MKKSIAFVVVSCDNYSDLWKGFFKTFFKYWPDCFFDIYLTSNYLKYPDPRVIPIIIGEDIDYATNLLQALSKIEQEWILLWLEDCMFSSRIDNNLVNDILLTAINTSNLGYLKLSNDYPVAYKCNEGYQFGKIPKGVKYRSAIGLSLYRKDVLIRLLENGKNAWELDKSDISDTFSEDFYALTYELVKKPILPYVNTVIKGKWYLPALNFLKREKLVEMILYREKQQLKEYLYIKFFWLWFRILRLFKANWYN